MRQSLKNELIDKWLAKYRLFHLRSIAEMRAIRGKVDTRKVKGKDKIKWYNFPTQVIRRDIARGLGELYDISLEFAREDALTLKEREKWSRLAAYIAQTINTIIDSYDEVQIEETLDELKQYVKVHVEGE
jgi:hypothetical protein